MPKPAAQLFNNFVLPIARARERRMSALARNDNRFSGPRVTADSGKPMLMVNGWYRNVRNVGRVLF